MKYNKYVIVYKDKKLSCFVHNDTTGKQQLKFRKNDYIIFDTIEKAQKYIDFVITNIDSSQKSKALKLTIREDF